MSLAPQIVGGGSPHTVPVAISPNQHSPSGHSPQRSPSRNSSPPSKRARLTSQSTGLCEAVNVEAAISSDKAVPARMLIHADQASIIVGANGSVIQQIREASKCTINVVDKDIPLEMNPDLRILRIQGESLSHQAEALRQILLQAKDMGSSGEKPLRILLPNTAAGAIIGPKGSTITSMGSETNCKIELDKQMVPGLSDRCCRIWGGDLVGAVNRIHEILLQLKIDNRLQESDFELPMRCKISDQALDFVHKSVIPPNFTSGRTYDLLVTKEEASFIVGKQGVRIRAIRDSTRASVEIRDGPAQLRIVEIGGDFISKQKAVLMVLDDSFKRAEPLTSVQFMFDYQFWAYVDLQLPRLVDRTGVKIWWEDSDSGKCLSIAGPTEMRTLAAQLLAEIIESERFDNKSGTPQSRSPMQDRTPPLSSREFNNMNSLTNAAMSPGPGGAPPGPGGAWPGNVSPPGMPPPPPGMSPHQRSPVEHGTTDLTFSAGTSSPGPRHTAVLPGVDRAVSAHSAGRARSPGPTVRDFTRQSSSLSQRAGDITFSQSETALRDIARQGSLQFPDTVRVEMNIDAGALTLLQPHLETMGLRCGATLTINNGPHGASVVITGRTVQNAFAVLLIQEKLLRGSAPTLADGI